MVLSSDDEDAEDAEDEDADQEAVIF
jgi:hypothetical protein